MAAAVIAIAASIIYTRRFNRLSAEEQEALNEKWKAGSGGENSGCGGG